MSNSISNHFNKTDESFNPGMPEWYDLVLQVSDKEMSYSLFERGRNKFIAIGIFRDSIDRIMEENPWLKGQFNSIRILIENNSATLIPSVFFDPREKEKYLSFTVDHDPSDRICADYLISLDLFSIYSLASSLADKLNRYFPSGLIRHVSTSLIGSIWGNYKNLIRENRVFINIRKDNFDMVVFGDKQLSYFNSFFFQTPEDLAYYVIFVFEQLGLNPEEAETILLGKVEKTSPVYDLLYRYIRHIEMAVRNEAYTYSYVFRDIPGNSFYTLLNPVI